jgi:flavin-dependent dehydrogenase
LNALTIGQDATEAILRSHIEKYSCHIELATQLQSFEQHSDHVVAQLVKTTDDGQEVPETLSVSFLVGCDGARGTLYASYVEIDAESCEGIVRKRLGLTFVGETREAELMITGDIHIIGLDKGVSSASLLYSYEQIFTYHLDIVLALLGRHLHNSCQPAACT